MKLRTIIMLFLVCQNAYSQNKSELYEIDFHRKSTVVYIPLDQNDYNGYNSALKNKNELFRDYGREVLNGFRAVSILDLQGVKLFRVIESCSDCRNYYYLFYKSRSGKIRLIEEKNSLSSFKLLLKLYEKDGIILSEGNLHLLLTESYFHTTYNEYYSKLSGLPTVN